MEFQIAEIYAQWGDVPRALDALDRAVVLHDGGLAFTKADALLDPLRREPRFKAVLAGLKFPDQEAAAEAQMPVLRRKFHISVTRLSGACVQLGISTSVAATMNVRAQGMRVMNREMP